MSLIFLIEEARTRPSTRAMSIIVSASDSSSAMASDSSLAEAGAARAAVVAAAIWAASDS